MNNQDFGALSPEVSKAYFEATFNNANTGIAHVGTDGRWLRVNDTLCRLLAYPREELLALTFKDVTHPDDVDADVAQLQQLLRGEIDNYRMEKRYFRKDGRLIWVDLQVGALRGDDGQVLFCVSTILDISKRKRKEQRIREMHYRLRFALDVGRIGEWSLDLASGKARRNLRHDQIFGYERMLPGWSYDLFMQHVFPEDRAEVDATFRNSIVQGADWNFECRILRADSALRWIWARGSVTAREAGKPTRLSGVVQDITRRKRSEQTERFLAELTAPLGTLVDYQSTLQSVVRVAVPFLADCCVIDMIDEQAELRRVAASHKELENGNASADPGLADQASAALFRQIADQGTAQMKNDLNEQDLKKLTSDAVQLAALRKQQVHAFVGVPLLVRGQCCGVMALFAGQSGRRFTAEDVTLAQRIGERVSIALENARLYRAVRESDERKDIFLAMLAHELRNPLAAIGSGMELLRARAEGAASTQTLTMMQRQMKHLRRLLDDLLDVSRMTHSKATINKRNISLQPVLDDAVAAMQAAIAAKQQQLVVAFGAGNPRLQADSTRLDQVVSNLLGNACKYTPPGGRITLTTRLEGGEVVIEISDTGKGLAEDQLKSIFEPFTQTAAAGTTVGDGLGLGLSLVRDIVLLHGGAVHAASDGPDKGSTFTVRLPVAEPADQETTPARKLQLNTGKPLDILLVDDQDDFVQPTAKILQLNGHKVRQAHTGHDALSSVQQRRPDLMLLDIGLPDISGYEVARQLRGDPANAGIHLVALTGYGQTKDRERTRRAGFNEHLVKPLKFARLAELIQRL